MASLRPPMARLRQRVRATAAYCLLARHWPDRTSHSRHHAALCLGGFLARLGQSAAQAKPIAEAIARAAGDEEWRDRVKAVQDAVKIADWLDYGDGNEQPEFTTAHHDNEAPHKPPSPPPPPPPPHPPR